MLNRTQISIPNLVRVKPGAIGRVGLYARRHAFSEIVVLHSADLQQDLLLRLCDGLKAENIAVLQH